MKVDLRASHLEETRRSLEKEAKHLERDVKDEVERLEKLTGEK